MITRVCGAIADPFKIGVDPLNPVTRGVRTSRNPRLVAGERTAVFICAGQSNIACYADLIYLPAHAAKVDQISILDGAVCEGKDPFVGTTGVGGSWLGMFADKLIQGDKFDRVILLPIGVGSSTVEMWAPGGRLENNLNAAFERCLMLDLPVTAVMWQQGESSHFPNAAGYYVPLMSIINGVRDRGHSAPWFLGKSTYSTSDCISFSTSAGTRAAIDLAVNGTDIFPGADTDTIIGPTYRSAAPGNCIHFNATGQEAAATLWYNAVTPHI